MLSPDVFLSLLALDAYNRGYGRGVFANGSANDDSEAGRKIGNATILNVDLPAGSEAVGFYAIAYELDGAKIISYRGTNFEFNSLNEFLSSPAILDIYNGWGIGGGYAPSSQAQLAINFYESVAGGLSIYDTNGGTTTLVGHSLGGGLAGFVGALGKVDTFAYDHMPFMKAAEAQALSVALSRALDAARAQFDSSLGLSSLVAPALAGPGSPLYDVLQAFTDEFVDQWRRVRPSAETIKGIYVEGELVVPIRALDSAINGIDGSLLAPLLVYLRGALSALDVEGNYSEDIVVKDPVSNRGIEFGGGFADLVGRHSISLLTILQFGEKQWSAERGQEGWKNSAKFIFDKISDDGIGSSVGLRQGQTGGASEGDQLSSVVAYSAINEGTRLFGDTGIRALFNDADDLGRLLGRTYNVLSEETTNLIGGLIAEFSGLLAKNQVLSASSPQALSGVISVGESSPYLTIRTDRDYWSTFGDNPTFFSRQSSLLISNIFKENLSGAAQSELRSWLNEAASKKGFQITPLTTLAEYIDYVSFTFAGDSLFRGNDDPSYNGFQLFVGQDGNQSVGPEAGFKNTLLEGSDIFIGANGRNHLLGLGGHDALIGGRGVDELDGGAGDDLIVGGRGPDTLKGGSGKDIIHAGDFDEAEDSAGDTLTGGTGDDIFYIGNGDRITDIDRGDTVFLRGKRLSGGKETKPGSRIFLDEQGGRFVWAADGTLTYSINPTISIEGFRNGYGGIRLIEAEDDEEDDDGGNDDDDGGRPDFDPAERLRDPLIIDLDGDRNVISGRDSVAAYFDIDNDGFSERVSWARAGDGFLVRDLDGNGLIETGSELFGTGAVDSSAAQLQPFGEDGFAELALLDSNFDGAITAADTLFSQLRVWIDANLDARTDAGELVTLESLGIVSISLSTFDSDHVAITNDASVITRASTVGFANGSTRTIYDAYLSVDQFDARELAGDVTVDERIADLPFLLGSGNVSDLDIAMSRDAGLAELVREFSELTIENAHEILERAQQILLRWTGADQVAPDSRGPNINAQWLHALEAITGEEFVQSGSIGSDPRGDAAGVLIGEWQSLVTRTAARLVGQIPLGDALTPGLSFEGAAFFTVADGTTLHSILTSAAANQPTSKSEAIGYWAALVEILGMYREFLPIEAGVTGPPLVEEFDARLGAALTEAGIPFSLEDLRRILTVSSGEDKVIGRTRGAPTSLNDLIIIQGDAGRVDGASGDDIYVVGKNVGALDIVDASGNNELFLSDFLASDITVVAVVEDGRSWLRFSDASGALNMRVRVDVDVDSIETAVQNVRFGDGTTSNIFELIEGGGAALGVIFAGDGSDPVAGTAADDLIVGVGANNSYLFARGAGSDTIFDLSGEGDRIIVAGSVSDVEFTVGRTDDGDDLILRFRDTGESLRVVGHRSDRGREIELFEFADATLTLAQVDSILNSGSPSEDTIVGSRRDDLISGFAGDDILQGMGGRDTYFFDLGWGQDRIVEADSANAIVFGASVRVSDITAERGNNGDLVLRSSAGDKITIVGGLRSPIVTSFAFADGTTKTLTDIVDQLLAGGTNTISGTAADEELIGTAESETFVGNGGNDTFRGFGGVDFYRIDAPFTRVFGSAAGIDTLIAPTGAVLADLRFDDDRHVFVFGRNGPVAYADSELDYVRFSDGALVDLTGPGISLGTAGNDFLYSTGRAPTTFRSGAGNDVIIGSAKESALDTYEFEVGFGNDTIYDLGGQADRITFLSPELSVANATFQKIGSNLVIAFNSGDRLTIEGHFWNYSYDNGIPDLLGQDSGGIEFFTFGDGQSFAGVSSFLSSVTAGDDLVMSGSFAGLRDGGAGNDILFGGREANTYIFRAGYGHDIIKDDGGNNQSVRFFGLEPDDVVITRDPSDPFSIVFTIAATGETLTIDGSPDDGFLPDRDPRAALNERGLNIQQFVFSSVTLTAGDILDRVFAAEGTDGDNVIWGINSDRDIRPGLGNDIINIGNGQERVVIGPNSGSKIITFDPDGSRPESGPGSFSVFFEGISLTDLILVEVNEANGQTGRHLQLIAGETVVTILNGLDPRFNQVSRTEEGVVPRFSIQSDDAELDFGQGDTGAPIFIPLGPVSALVQGTDGADFLRAPRSFDGTPLPSQVIDPLADDDTIFGSSEGETVRFDVGYGVDRYEWAGGPLTVEVGEGLSRDDINISWSKTEPGLVEIGINGTSDKLIFDARALAKIRVGGETLTTGAYPDSDISSLPASSVEPDQQLRSGSGDERIIATGGSATIVIAPTSGSDYLEDARLDAAAGGIDGLDGWSPNTLVIDEIGSVDQLRFIVESGRPNDLIIEKPNGERITILNQFAFGIPDVAPPLRSPDIDGDGSADWANFDLNGDGAPDFAALDPDGDGTPGWLSVDLNGDGANDWTTFATASASFDGGEVYAEDYDLDGNFEYYSFYADDLFFAARDVDFDGVADEYSEDGLVWTPAPQDPAGNVEWSLLDINGNGVSDLDGFATLGGPSWLSAFNPQTGATGWSVRGFGELYDADGAFVAERQFDLATGASTYFVYGDGASDDNTTFIAQDIDGDGQPDLVGADFTGDLVADPIADTNVPVVVSRIVLRQSTPPFFTERQVPLGSVISRIEFVASPPVTVLNLADFRDPATDGADHLLLGTGEELDSLAGDDVVTSFGEGGVFRWSAGDGNDLFKSTLRIPGGDNFAGPATTALDTIRFDGILDPAQLRFLVSATNPANLVVEIIATGERLTIEGQLGALDGGQRAAPPVARFVFGSGVVLTAGEVATLLRDPVDVDGSDTQTTNNEGGLLDAGANADGEAIDQLRGGTGNDIYRFGREYGEDLVLDAGGVDAVQFGSEITRDELFFSRTGQGGKDLLIEVLGADRLALTIVNQFAGEANRIESFVFDDGSRLSWQAVQEIILDIAETNSDDEIRGFLTDDIIRGGRGNDVLTGGGGNDQIFGGEGRDRAIFTGRQDEYDISTNGEITIVTDSVANRDGVTRLISVEDLQFRADDAVTPIAPVNIAPVVNNVTLEGNEDATLLIDAATLLAAATDPNGDQLRIANVGAAFKGKVWIGVDGNVRFLPDIDFAGEAGFDFVISDGNGGLTTARALVSVRGSNDAPRIAVEGRTFTTFEDRPIDWFLPTGAITDPDGDPLVFEARLSSGEPLPDWLTFDGNRFTGTPPSDFNGLLAIVLTASDGNVTTSSNLTIEVLPINDAPRQVSALADQIFRPGEAFAFTLPTNTFLDVEGDPLSFDIVSSDGSLLPDWLTIDGLTISGTIPDGQVAPVNLALRASDGASTSIATFAINPAPNAAPTVGTQLGPVSGTEDQAFSFTLPDNVFVDADQDSLAITAVLSDGSPLPSWLSFENATFSGSPPQDFNGVLAIRLSATDGRASVSQNFVLTINPVNDAPVLVVPLADAESPEDTGFSVSIPTETFGDVDGDALTFSATLAGGAPLFDWLRLEGSTIVGTPPQDFNGDIDIVVLASDGLLSASDTFRLTISSTNDAPVVLVPLPDFTVAEDQPIMLDRLTAGFGDDDGDALTFTLTGANGAALPTWLSLANGQLVGTPPANLNGVFDLELRASDGAQSVVDAFRLTLSPVNDAPVLAQPLTDQTATGIGPVSITIPAGAFTDPDGDALTYTARLADGSELPQWLAFNAASRTFTGTAPNANAALNVRLTASDGALSASDDFLLTVTAQAENGGSSTGFRQVGLNSWFNPSWGGGYNVTFEYQVQPDAIVDGRLKAWDILASYTGPGTITNGWVSGFPGTTTFQIVPGGARFTNTGQSYQPSLGEGTRFQVSVQVDGAAYNPAHFGLSIFDRDPAFNLADDSDTLLTVAPTSVWAGGLSQNLTLRNTGATAIDGWQVVLDVPTGVTLNITSVWGATATTLTSGDIMFRALSSNESVATGAETSFGFNASYSGVSTLPLSRGMFSFTDGDARQFDAVIASLTGTGLTSNWRYGTAAVDALTAPTTADTRLFGGVGADTINGNAGADWIAGGSGDDVLYGNGGNDRFWGGAGNDLLYGGVGTDSAYLFGVRSSYSLVTQAGALGLRVTDLGAIAHGDDGIDQLSSIEQLVFRGGETINIASPIILDLDGDGVRTLSAVQSEARFDLDGDGLADDTSWISAGDAFLYLDRDSNGTVSGYEEISFVDDVPNARTDLAGLAGFDSNSDRVLDARDARFADFGVWRDADGDGAVDEGETASLAAVGIRSLNLVGTPVNQVTEFGEVAIANTGSLTLTNGTTRSFADAALTYFSAATNLPSLGVTQYDFDRKASKFRISAAGGALTVGSRNTRSDVDPLAGQLGANTILNFRDGDYGMFAPVVLDLDGDGVELVSRKKSRAGFDYAGDGAADDTGWIGRDDGFLVIDRNNDGLITEAAELSLASEDEEARGGLQGLARLDSNSDGVVDQSDARFGELRVWRDGNGNGRTDAGELLTLEQAGVVAIRLNAVTPTQQNMKLDRNMIAATASFVRTNGSTSTVADVSLAYRPVSAPAAPVAAFDLAERLAGFDTDLFLAPREIDRQSRFDQLPSVSELAAMLSRADAETVSDMFDRVSAAATPARVRSAQQVTIAPQATEAVPLPPRVFDPSSLYFAMYDSVRLNAWRGGVGELADIGLEGVVLSEPGQVPHNKSGNSDPFLIDGMSDEPSPGPSEPRQLLNQSAHELWGSPAWIGSLPVSEASAEANPPSTAFVPATSSNSPVTRDDSRSTEAAQPASNNPHEALAKAEAVVEPPTLEQTDHLRLDPAQHELWGGPLHVSLFGSSPESEEPGVFIEAATSDAMHGLADVEIARKLAMIRQDLSTFGATGVGEVERLRQLPAQAMDIFA